VFLGAASFVPRPDVAAVFGGRFLQAGFQLSGVSLPPGSYDLVVFARSTVTRTFNASRVVRIEVD
jgi:hypothetical protein